MDGITWRAATRAEPAPADADAVVVDTYRAAPRDIAGAGRPLVCMHDRGKLPADVALVIAAASQAAGPRHLSGLRHACLRRPFWDCPGHKVRASIERVLVAAGGGELLDEALDLALRARATAPGISVAVVCGPYATVDAPPGIDLIRAPASLRAALDWSDLIVTAAGQTALEAAACGTPAVVTALVENQRANARTLVSAGTAAPLTDPAELGRVLSDLAQPGKRRELSEAGQRAVDGQGARRVAAAIAEVVRA